MIRIGNIKLGVVSLEDDVFTYGNRIALGDIFGNMEISEYQRMKEAFREVYGYSCRLVPIGKRVQMLHKLVKEFAKICQNEQELLKHTPTADELAAGILDLSKRVGPISTYKALAKDFGKDPDEILRWPYSKVLGLLYADLEEYKFNERYSKVIDAKYKRNN